MRVSRAGALRLRKRSRWVGALQYSLGLEGHVLGQVLKGRWTPDLPRINSRDTGFLAAFMAGGARILGAGSVRLAPREGEGDKGPSRPVTFVELDLGGGRQLVCPELIAHLSNQACFRKRDSALVSSMRVRAMEWAKSRSVDLRDTALLLPGSVAVACLPSTPEQAAETVFKSRAMVGSNWFPWAMRRGVEEWWKAAR